MRKIKEAEKAKDGESVDRLFAVKSRPSERKKAGLIIVPGTDFC